MKILYDYQAFTIQNYGGISKYFSELIKRFPYDGFKCNVGILFSNNENYGPSFNPKLRYFFPEFKFKGKVKVLSMLNALVTSKYIFKNDFDLFHLTYYNTNHIKMVGNKPFVVTFYDLIHEKLSFQFPEFKADQLIVKNKKKLLDTASRIISISETTKKDIVEFYGIDSSRIEVIHLGNSFCLNNGSKMERLVDEDYILFVGNRSFYKNFTFFLETIADLLIKYNLKLVCAGGGDFTPLERKFIDHLGLSKRIIIDNNIIDDVLRNYYENALFFCFPSLYEGFGIPVLESFACRCPALLSNKGSLPEVGSDAANYFNPYDKQSLFVAANSLINDADLRHNMVSRGYKRVEKFTWENTFHQTLELYKSIKAHK